MGRKCDASAMCTPTSVYSLPSTETALTESASSKSLADLGSIVMVRTLRKSTRSLPCTYDSCQCVFAESKSFPFCWTFSISSAIAPSPRSSSFAASPRTPGGYMRPLPISYASFRFSATTVPTFPSVSITAIFPFSSGSSDRSSPDSCAPMSRISFGVNTCFPFSLSYGQPESG